MGQQMTEEEKLEQLIMIEPCDVVTLTLIYSYEE